MTPTFSLRDILVRRGGHFALQIESLDFRPGGIYTLAGPNGAGKSTLLYLLALLAPPDRGQLSFAGEPVRWQGRPLQRQRRQITLVHQSPYLFDRSVQQNLAYGLGLRGIQGKEAHRRIAEALWEVGLQGFEGRSARQLSGGESQRVALARALVLRPEVLLLDEPTSNVDIENIRALERVIVTLPQRGITVIMASHDRQQPERLGSEVLRLVGGRLAEHPKPVPPAGEPSAREKVQWLHPSKKRDR